MKWKLLIIALLALGIASCGSSKDYTKQEVGLKEDLGQKNRVNLPLKQQIRQLPGVTFRNNVPVIVKNQTDIYGGTQDNFEPLYLLNDYRHVVPKCYTRQLSYLLFQWQIDPVFLP